MSKRRATSEGDAADFSDSPFLIDPERAKMIRALTCLWHRQAKRARRIANDLPASVPQEKRISRAWKRIRIPKRVFDLLDTLGALSVSEMCYQDGYTHGFQDGTKTEPELRQIEEQIRVLSGRVGAALRVGKLEDAQTRADALVAAYLILCENTPAAKDTERFQKLIDIGIRSVTERDSSGRSRPTPEWMTDRMAREVQAAAGSDSITLELRKRWADSLRRAYQRAVKDQ